MDVQTYPNMAQNSFPGIQCPGKEDSIVIPPHEWGHKHLNYPKNSGPLHYAFANSAYIIVTPAPESNRNSYQTSLILMESAKG